MAGLVDCIILVLNSLPGLGEFFLWLYFPLCLIARFSMSIFILSESLYCS